MAIRHIPPHGGDLGPPLLNQQSMETVHPLVLYCKPVVLEGSALELTNTHDWTVATNIDQTILDSTVEVETEIVLVVASAKSLDVFANERKYGIDIASCNIFLGSDWMTRSISVSLCVPYAPEINVVALGDSENAKAVQAGEEFKNPSWVLSDANDDK
ncbi:hypothetical protein BCON_0036g00720 [Botryotinia convoluta]|uniref:Uncharacterized protein n=1 Tax=Botryotinia convoluta TaxID=54673 RepID=A0A4Z1IFI7_9HELO|nr:hypothetical protein BCON_0036g00720 [Botryotinia convoluta]